VDNRCDFILSLGIDPASYGAKHSPHLDHTKVSLGLAKCHAGQSSRQTLNPLPPGRDFRRCFSITFCIGGLDPKPGLDGHNNWHSSESTCDPPRLGDLPFPRRRNKNELFLIQEFSFRIFKNPIRGENIFDLPCYPRETLLVSSDHPCFLGPDRSSMFALHPLRPRGQDLLRIISSARSTRSRNFLDRRNLSP